MGIKKQNCYAKESQQDKNNNFQEHFQEHFQEPFRMKLRRVVWEISYNTLIV